MIADASSPLQRLLARNTSPATHPMTVSSSEEVHCSISPAAQGPCTRGLTLLRSSNRQLHAAIPESFHQRIAESGYGRLESRARRQFIQCEGECRFAQAFDGDAVPGIALVGDQGASHASVTGHAH